MSSRNLRNMQTDLVGAHLVGKDGEESIKVCVRARPSGPGDKKAVVEINGQSIRVTGQGGQEKNFTFNYVGDQNSTQQGIFENLGKPATDSFIEGYNACVMAYGQTGSGKTHTLWGKYFDSHISRSDDP